ncbi:MAG: hypothetical protein M0R06_06200 [Sphaerochaeta sp.]|jgi:hypothetical protein|nr:hypothetical protein [Sphaerochaeta sp.]
MAKGDRVFSDEEVKAVYGGFFEDGKPRDVVVIDRTIEEKTSRKGLPYTQVIWKLADAKTGEVTSLKDFNFTGMMKPFKKTIRYEISVYRVTQNFDATITKETGYDTYFYDVEYVGEDGNAPIAAEDEPNAKKDDILDQI